MSMWTPLSESLLRIYDAAYSQDGWTEAMEACRRATQAAHVLYYAYGIYDDITFSTEGGSPTLKLISAAFEEYNKMFREPGVTGYDDVGAKFMQQSSFGLPVKDTDIWSLEWLENREEVKFVREKIEIFRKLYLNTSEDPLINAGVHFWYDASYSSIPDGDIRTAAMLGPHLAKAFDIARWAENLRSRHRAVLSVLDRVEMGVCVADRFGRLMISNRHASEIFSQADGLWSDQSGRLATAVPERTAEIQDAVTRVARTSFGAGEVNSMEFAISRRGSENPLLVIVSPLRDADMELERNLHGSLVAIIDTDRFQDLKIEALGKAYGFTTMEQKAAKLMVSGLTTPELGEELGVATSTAQTHVKSVLHKTRSRNRANFVWRALQFSPPIS